MRRRWLGGDDQHTSPCHAMLVTRSHRQYPMTFNAISSAMTLRLVGLKLWSLGQLASTIPLSNKRIVRVGVPR